MLLMGEMQLFNEAQRSFPGTYFACPKFQESSIQVICPRLLVHHIAWCVRVSRFFLKPSYLFALSHIPPINGLFPCSTLTRSVSVSRRPQSFRGDEEDEDDMYSRLAGWQQEVAAYNRKDPLKTQGWRWWWVWGAKLRSWLLSGQSNIENRNRSAANLWMGFASGLD